MTQTPPHPTHQRLAELAARMDAPEYHLRQLGRDSGRFGRFSARGGGLFYDFSRQRVTADIMEALLGVARERGVLERFVQMTAGEKLNRSENRAALHTACRSFTDIPLLLDGMDIMPEIRRIREEIRSFSQDVRSGRITSAAGLPFRDIVVVGIGGSYLGPEFVSTALAHRAGNDYRLYYLSNVDINDFGRVAAAIDPQRTLWVVISKSYTTPETLCNTRQVEAFLRGQGIDPAAHLVTVTSKGSPGDDPDHPVLRSFHMFDYIGGRYSVTSAVGGVPLSLYLGYEDFERFLHGAQEMDRHAATAPPERNIALIAALLTYWNTQFLGYPAMAVIPYASPLSRLPAHIQQLSMESNGKSVDADGTPLDAPSGTIIFGEPGTNAQHSFFQLAHQGAPFPIEFIGVLQPVYGQYRTQTGGVTNHQELWSNLLAQQAALADGHENPDPARTFTGNRPSSTLVLEDLSPENIGRLLAFYEAKTVCEAFLWGINPFDQFGVELGKRIAGDIRRRIARRNEHPGSRAADEEDGAAGFYLDALFNGCLPEAR